MSYVLYSVPTKSQVSDVFATEKDLWAFVRAKELCSEVVEREDIDARLVLHPGYEIHVCGADGERLDQTVIRQWT